MREKGGCKGCGGSDRTGLSRSEFLASGASIAAAASLTGFMAADRLGAAPTPKALSQAPCRANCRPDDQRWSIPASVLNAFWSDCFPRLVAKWCTNTDPVDSFNHPSNAPDLTAEMNAFLTFLRGDIAKLAKGSCRFEERRTAVLKYLDEGGKHRIPIRLMSAPGFDFVLSDWGLDLFFPPCPQDAVELLLYYTYRRTGNPAIGIPFFMVGSTPVIDISAPTGPSQAWIDPEIIVGMVEGAAVAGFTTKECANMTIVCLQESEVTLDRQTLSKGPTIFDKHGTIARSSRSRTRTEPRRVGSRYRPERFARLPDSAPDSLRTNRRQPSQQRTGGELGVSIQTMSCVLDAIRCWQLSGAVYRGIQVELPRVIATTWLEKELGVNAETECYSNRLATQPAALREILMERLETSLPENLAMKLEFQPPPPMLGAAPPVIEFGFWDKNDIMISNQGIFLPEVKPLASYAAPATPNGPPEPLKSMLQAISDGTAGNPVFTDSMRSE